MLLAQDLIDEMADMPDAPEIVLVEKQVVPDIMRYMPWKLERSEAYYDRIWMFFDAGTVEEVGEGVFDFLKDQIAYLEEDDDAQVLSTPKEMLERGDCDCKGYALFVAGVVDGINRNSGRPEIPFCFRFVPSKILGTKIGHVFVVLDPGGKEVWVDPVLGSFDEKPFYMVHKDRYAEGSGRSVGRLDMSGRGVGSAESNLLSQLSLYQQGLIEAVNLSLSTSTINTITQYVVMGIVTYFAPYVAIAIKVLSLGDAPMNNAFGPGSVGARVYADITSFNVINLFNDIVNGRTFNSDQYWGAALYYYYVEGKDITDQDQVTDAMVMPALKWLIDRTGVFISGRQHIMGLIAGQDDYTAYAKVDSDTTTDTNLVRAAVTVAQRYWQISGTANENYRTFDSSLKGSWASTIGVFDGQLAQIAASYDETSETYAAQTGDQYAVNENLGLSATAPSWQAKLVEVYQKPLAWVLSAAALGGIVLLILDDE